MKIQKSILIKRISRNFSNQVLSNNLKIGKSGLPYEVPLLQDENTKAINLLMKDLFEYQREEDSAQIVYDNMMRIKNISKK